MRRLFEAGLVVAAALSLFCCGKGDDVQAVRKMIARSAALGEKHDIGGLMKLATEDFLALPGPVDRQSVRAILWRAFNYYGVFKILHPLPEVNIDSDGKNASANFPFLIVREHGSFPGLKEFTQDPRRWLEEVGENADLYSLNLELIKEKSDWSVRKAILKKFTGRSFKE